MTQWRRRAYKRVQLASVEMMKPPSHVRTRMGLDYGCPRCDDDVWQALDPSSNEEFNPNWIEDDGEMLEADAFYHDQWREKYGGR